MDRAAKVPLPQTPLQTIGPTPIGNSVVDRAAKVPLPKTLLSLQTIGPTPIRDSVVDRAAKVPLLKTPLSLQTIGPNSPLKPLSDSVVDRAAKVALPDDELPAPDEIMDFLEIRDFIRDNYIEYTWPKVKLENLCVPKGGTDLVKFSPTQELIRNYFTPESAYKGVLCWHSIGTGKCHAKNTPILMYSGDIKLVQDIQVGDLIMGDDSTPRNVLSLGQGRDTMYKIHQAQGDSYTVNSEHILCLKDGLGEIYEMEVKDYLKLGKELKGYKMPVEFKHSPIVFDAYDVGADVYKGKIPQDYLLNSTKIRLEVLAGIIDVLGKYDGLVYSIDSQSSDVVFLARSLGFSAKLADNKITITGQGIEHIPVRNPALKAQVCTKDVLTYKITVTNVGEDDYYGFTLDGNNRFLLGDFTVTHNTCLAIATATSSFEQQGYTILWVTRASLKSDLWKNMFDQVCSLVIKERIQQGLVIPADSSRRMRLLSKSWKIKALSYKQFSNLVTGKNQFYKDLVKINGLKDPLRKTLLVIDEAHKLYSSGDLSANERPNMSKLEGAINNSYKISGKDSVKLLFLTGTPVQNDPLDLIKLINLLREQKMPTTFDKFSQEYLDSDGKFTKRGSRKYLNDIAGSVSYLNREKDVRTFSQPTIIPINVPLGKSEFSAEKLKEYENEYDEIVEKSIDEIAYQKKKISEVKQDRVDRKRELKDKCIGLRTVDRTQCLRDAESNFSVLEKHFDEELTEHAEKINKLTQYNTEMKKALATKKRLAKEDTSQEGLINEKCMKIKRKKKKV